MRLRMLCKASHAVYSMRMSISLSLSNLFSSCCDLNNKHTSERGKSMKGSLTIRALFSNKCNSNPRDPRFFSRDMKWTCSPSYHTHAKALKGTEFKRDRKKEQHSKVGTGKKKKKPDVEVGCLCHCDFRNGSFLEELFHCCRSCVLRAVTQ